MSEGDGPPKAVTAYAAMEVATADDVMAFKYVKALSAVDEPLVTDLLVAECARRRIA